jgi:hypothetical protein
MLFIKAYLFKNLFIHLKLNVMKKSIIFFFLLTATFLFCQNQNVIAAKRPTVIKSPFSVIKISSPSNNLKFFDLGVGYMNDPNNASILYVIFGNSSGSTLTIVKVYISGALQPGTGVTVSGSYSQIGSGQYRVTGTITRADQTSFSCSGIYDMN